MYLTWGLGFSGYAGCTLSQSEQADCLNNRNIIEKKKSSYGKQNYLVGQVLVLGVNTPWVDSLCANLSSLNDFWTAK